MGNDNYLYKKLRYSTPYHVLKDKVYISMRKSLGKDNANMLIDRYNILLTKEKEIKMQITLRNNAVDYIRDISNFPYEVGGRLHQVITCIARTEYMFLHSRDVVIRENKITVYI